MSSEGRIDSDFDDTNTISVIHALKLIIYLLQIMFYLSLIVICNNCSK